LARLLEYHSAVRGQRGKRRDSRQRLRPASKAENDLREDGLTIASWLLEVEAGRSGSVREALAQHPGIECRSEVRGSMVVLTQAPAECGLGKLRETLSRIPGVRAADLVTAFEDDEVAVVSRPA